MNNPFISAKDYMSMCEAYDKIIEKDKLNADRKAAVMTEEYNDIARTIIQTQINNDNKIKKYSEFTKSVKESFVGEIMFDLLSKSLNESHNIEEETPIMRSLIGKYIKENGVNNIVSGWKNRSYFLSEMAAIVEKAYNGVCKDCDCNKPDSFTISTNIRDEFFDSLKAADMESMGEIISVRVANAASEFITSNRIDKQNIQTILQDAKDKIDSAKESERAKVEESANIIAKRKIANIRSNSNKGLYHSIVESLAKNSLLDNEFKNIFTENSNLNMKKIVHHADIMYTFLEMLNTSKMDTMTEDKIANFVKSL